MTATLKMPVMYADIIESDFDELDGGIAPLAVVGIITGAMAVGGGLYTVGQIAGERAYYTGLRKPA